MKNLNEIIKENEEGFEKSGLIIGIREGNAFKEDETDYLKSHLHQSQLKIVEWVREWVKDKNKGLEIDNNGNHTCNPRCHDSGKEETLFNLLQELDKIV